MELSTKSATSKKKNNTHSAKASTTPTTSPATPSILHQQQQTLSTNNHEIYVSAAAFARSKKQSENTQKNYMSKMSVIANFLYSDEEDLRKYVTRYETNISLTGPIMQIKEKKNKGPSYYLKINIPCPLSVWEKVFGMLMTDCSLVRKKNQE